MATPLTLTLHDGVMMPQLGFGVWQVPDEQATPTVLEAVKAGYRAIDTAAIYENEHGVGEAIKQAGVPREELFITTKLWNDRHGYAQAMSGYDESLKLLGLEQVDLYLIHWPTPREDRYVDAWRALIKLKEQGRVRSIGVSNFHIHHLQRLIDETGVVPSVNQVELHPFFQQQELRAFHATHGIATESWSPLAQGKILNHPTLAGIAARHERTPSQVVLRWHLDSGLIVIPKSVTPARIQENFDIFDFALDANDMAAIAAMDSESGRIGPDPETFAP